MNRNIAFSIPALRNTVRASCIYKIFKHNFCKLFGGIAPCPPHAELSDGEKKLLLELPANPSSNNSVTCQPAVFAYVFSAIFSFSWGDKWTSVFAKTD